MAIKDFHENLPARPRAQANGGWLPDGRTRFGHILPERWMADAEVDKPRARPDARFRHSDAAGCARAIAYAALDKSSSNPMDVAGHWATSQGTQIHDAWQEELLRVYGPDAKIEVVVGEDETAGHVDAQVSLGDKLIAIEGKSVGGYAYQLAVGAKGQAQGPRRSAVVQGALNAHFLKADELVIIYWARDAISVQLAERKKISDPIGRVCAEWTLTRDEYEPLAEAELARVEAILAELDKGYLPARTIPELPDGAVVVDPRVGAWLAHDRSGAAINAGTTWHCVYCRYQDMCIGTPAGVTAYKEEDTHE